jgi:glycosyltransferase involved in cell wall biosynthesis
MGRGELEPVVRHAAATDTRIRYLGNLSRPDLLATYTAADVLVNPHSTVLLTARYVFPSKLLEYLASGRSVITTATPEIAANYGDLCTVLDREEPQALADAIMRVAAMPAADRLARAAGARVAVIERCAWARQERRLVQFLEDQVRLTPEGLVRAFRNDGLLPKLDRVLNQSRSTRPATLQRRTGLGDGDRQK